MQMAHHLTTTTRPPCNEEAPELPGLSFGDFSGDIPRCFFKVLDGIAFQISAPNIFHCIAKIEAHMLGDLYALDAAGVFGIVRRVIDGIGHAVPLCCAPGTSRLAPDRAGGSSGVSKPPAMRTVAPTLQG